MAEAPKVQPPVARKSIDTFSVQSVYEMDSVSWENSSALTKLLTIATVCNKAKFVFSDEHTGTLWLLLRPTHWLAQLRSIVLFITNVKVKQFRQSCLPLATTCPAVVDQL